MNDTKVHAPAPPPTTHADDRELGYGAVDARPDIGDSRSGGGESGDDARADAPAPGSTNPNATSNRRDKP